MAGGAERQRQYRRRQRDGLFCVTVEVGFDLFDALARSGRIGQWDPHAADAVEAAIATLLDDWKYTVMRNARDPLGSDRLSAR